MAMMINKLTEDVSVAPQITVEDIPAIAAAGFKTIICNRPDEEELGQAACGEIESAAKAHGMTFAHQPVVSGQIALEDVAEFKTLLEVSEKPLLAYCRSGTRCAVLWAFSQAGSAPTEDIVRAAQNAGYDLSGLAGAISAAARPR
jgi:uncharacterized protein (TIGR01244 family)